MVPGRVRPRLAQRVPERDDRRGRTAVLRLARREHRPNSAFYSGLAQMYAPPAELSSSHARNIKVTAGFPFVGEGHRAHSAGIRIGPIGPIGLRFRLAAS